MYVGVEFRVSDSRLAFFRNVYCACMYVRVYVRFVETSRKMQIRLGSSGLMGLGSCVRVRVFAGTVATRRRPPVSAPERESGFFTTPVDARPGIDMLNHKDGKNNLLGHVH